MSETEVEQKNKGGRPKGSRNKRTLLREAALAQRNQFLSSTSSDPLSFLIAAMRNEELPIDKRLQAARDAAPYLHPKLAAIEHSGTIATAHEDALDELE